MNNIILGTMNIEYPYSSNHDKNIDTYKKIIEYYFESVENPILDTAYYYGNTKTEYILGHILKDINKPYKIATKANPWFNNDFTNSPKKISNSICILFNNILHSISSEH